MTTMTNEPLCPICQKPAANHHHAASSIGSAPRAPKANQCAACGGKTHQNLAATTLQWECLYFQFCAATGQTNPQLRTNGTTVYKLPSVTPSIIGSMAQWVNGQMGQTFPVADLTTAPTTSAGAKRAAERAKTATDQPTVPSAPPEAATGQPEGTQGDPLLASLIHEAQNGSDDNDLAALAQPELETDDTLAAMLATGTVAVAESDEIEW